MDRVRRFQFRRCPQPGRFAQNTLRDGEEPSLGLLKKLFVGVGESYVPGFQRTDQRLHQCQITADDFDGFTLRCQLDGLK